MRLELIGNMAVGSAALFAVLQATQSFHLSSPILTYVLAYVLAYGDICCLFQAALVAILQVLEHFRTANLRFCSSLLRLIWGALSSEQGNWCGMRVMRVTTNLRVLSPQSKY